MSKPYRIKVGVSKNLLTSASELYPDVSATQAIEFLILEGLQSKSQMSASERQGMRNEQSKPAAHKG